MNHPEIVEDYFEMLSRLLRTAPDIIFTATAPGTGNIHVFIFLPLQYLTC
jgi:hypothetical protein